MQKAQRRYDAGNTDQLPADRFAATICVCGNSTTASGIQSNRLKTRNIFLGRFTGVCLVCNHNLECNFGVRRYFAAKILMNFTDMFVAAPGSRTRKAFLAGTALAAVALLPSVAQAQSVWGGSGHTTS